ncbi:MAG: Kelch repeat-containing protein [Jejuia sp.]
MTTSIFNSSRYFSNLFFGIAFLSYVANGQNDTWIDKDENENYTARHECSFVQAGDEFIMFGGREKAQQLDIYDFKTDTWSKGGSAPKQFNHFQATFYEGFIWVIGSFKTNKFPREEPADFIWLYHPPTKTWIKGPEIPENRRRGGAGLVVYDDKFYVVGGNTIGHDGGYVNWFDEYNPVTNTWTILDDAPNARDHFSALTFENKLYALGGRHSGGEGGVFAPLVADVDVYNFSTKTWSSLKEPLPTPRAAPGVALFNNELFVIGGEGKKPGPAYKVVEAYNPKVDSWSTKTSMRFPRHGTQAIVSGKGIYIAGGSPNRGGGRQHNLEVYSEDKPKGKHLVASKIYGPKQICVSKNSLESFSIRSKKGNTGSFITSISIIGEDKLHYKLLSNYNLRLLKSSETLNIQIEGIDNLKSDSATLEIIYNDNSKLLIPISTK